MNNGGEIPSLVQAGVASLILIYMNWDPRDIFGENKMAHKHFAREREWLNL